MKGFFVYPYFIVIAKPFLKYAKLFGKKTKIAV